MIVIPMAGLSRRFFDAGYTRPKYELPLGPQTLFACCVRSFEHYFPTERFVFVHRNAFEARDFIARECDRLGVHDYVAVGLKEATRGQAETVLRGLDGAGADGRESLLIFNIDTIRPHYRFPDELRCSDGYLEVFAGQGEHWSFARPAASFGALVAETAEKRRISSLCSSGLYYFARAADFASSVEAALADDGHYLRQWRELYIAPLYNRMIAAGQRVMYQQIGADEVHFSGTPDEYRALRDSGRDLF
jgi:hypothetical protein